MLRVFKEKKKHREKIKNLYLIDHVKASISSLSLCTAIFVLFFCLFFVCSICTKGVSFAPWVFHVHCFVRVVFRCFYVCIILCDEMTKEDNDNALNKRIHIISLFNILLCARKKKKGYIYNGRWVIYFDICMKNLDDIYIYIYNQVNYFILKSIV